MHTQGVLADESGQTLGTLPATRKHSAASDNETWRLLALLGFTAILWFAFDLQTDGLFVTPRNVSNLTTQVAITALVALGANWVLVVRQIDLASGSLLSVSGVAAVYAQVRFGWSIPTAIVFALLIGLVIGAIHGTLIVRAGIPSFIVTLAGLMYLLGISFIVTNGFVLSGAGNQFFSISNGSIPTSATLGIAAVCLIAVLAMKLRPVFLGRDRRPWRAPTLRLVQILGGIVAIGTFALFLWAFVNYEGLPNTIAVLGVVAFAMWFIGRHTPFGRHLYGIGGNPEAARRVGINVDLAIVIVFMVAGLLSATGGVLIASRLDSASPDVGSLVTLNAISAAVVGGTSLFGGRGSVIGTLVGALTLGSILNGLSLMAVNTYYEYVAIGWILLLAVAVDGFARRRAANA